MNNNTTNDEWFAFATDVTVDSKVVLLDEASVGTSPRVMDEAELDDVTILVTNIIPFCIVYVLF